MAKNRTMSLAEMKSHTLAKPYVPSVAGLRRGDSGEQVNRLQQYLERFGYLDGGAHAADFDDATEAALRRFQRMNNLTESGILTDQTLERISTPRCGCPDHGGPARGGVSEYVLRTSKWPRVNLTYSFDNTTADLTAAEVKGAVHQAMMLWAEHTPLTFRPVASGGDIILKFVAGAHGCKKAFDGVGGTLAHASFPPPGAGDVHFDEDEVWSVATPPCGTDLFIVAAHELGHALGIDHSTVREAVMYAYYDTDHRNLDPDDIAAIRALYGTIERQRGWQWCEKCEGLAFHGSDHGVCPAGGVHSTRNSGHYALALDSPAQPGQANWRRCSQCAGLFFGGNSPNVCPAGGPHFSSSYGGDYTLAHNDSHANGQANWRYCAKCKGLHFGGNGPGVCPAGGGHVMNSSGNYTLFHL